MEYKRSSRRIGGLGLALLSWAFSTRAQHILLEAEQFADLGGWDLDQQSMEVMGSPYLLEGLVVDDAVQVVPAK